MKHIKLFAALAVIVLAVVGCSEDYLYPIEYPVLQPGGTTENVDKPVATDNIVVAHRCGAKEFNMPDNSVAALTKCIQNNLYAAEIDIHITKDERVVVFHDDTFHGLIFKDYTYAELCNAGKLANGEELPLFETFVELVVKGGCTRLWVDIKSMDSAYGGDEFSTAAGIAAAKIVHSMKAENFIEFIVGRIAVLKGVRNAVNGKWAIGYMNTAYTQAQFTSNGISWANFEVSSIYNNAAKIKTYVEKDVRMSTYNADTQEQMEWFAAQKNLYAVCTNYPIKLLGVYGVNRN